VTAFAPDLPALRRPRAADLLAAASIAGLLLPEAVAYARIGGLPPEAGLAALFAGLVIYGLFGASPVAIASATSSSAAVLAASIASNEAASPALRAMMAAALVTMTGAVFLVGAAFRLGAISSFISRAVLRGFALGLSWTLILRQAGAMGGVPSGSSNFFLGGEALAQHHASWNLAGLALGAAALAGLSLCGRLPRVPAALAVLVAGIAVGHSGWAGAHGIALAGRIDLAGAGIPSIPMLPIAAWERTGELAFAVALILYAESYTSIRTFTAGHGASANRDLFALGLANVASGLLRGLPVGAGFSATAAHVSAGAVSRASGLLAAGFLALAVALLAPWIEQVPEPVLAAVVIHALRHAADPRALAPFFAWRRDRVPALVAFAAVLLLGVLYGLLIGIAASLAMTLRQLAEPRVSWLGRLPGSHDFVDGDLHGEARPVPGLLVARPEEPLFFANAERVFDVLRARIADASRDAQAPLRAFVLSLEGSSDLDSASLEQLGEFADELARQGVLLRIARARDTVREAIGRLASAALTAPVFAPWSVDDAVASLAAGDPAPAWAPPPPPGAP
jgi:MFS superfamily sulfate permease-like transporter